MKKDAGFPSGRKLRMTRQRKVILEEIRKVRTHPTADEVYEMVRRRIPRISMGTVYRDLDILSEYGMIQKLGGQQRRFDGNMQNHYHVRCISCGRVEDVPMRPLERIEDSAHKICGYEIRGHSLEFIGLCPECKRKEKRAGKRARKR
jgi:Fur family ferric uptake transcriptional regulator